MDPPKPIPMGTGSPVPLLRRDQGVEGFAECLQFWDTRLRPFMDSPASAELRLQLKAAFPTHHTPPHPIQSSWTNEVAGDKPGLSTPRLDQMPFTDDE